MNQPSDMATRWDILLAELSTGLAQLLDRDIGGRRVDVYPRTLRIGISRLATAMIRAGERPIHSISDAVEMFQKPVGLWNVSPRPPEHLNGLTIMDGDYITEDAEELIVDNPDVSGELTQRIMVRVIENCRTRGDQDGYVSFRRFIIEHPVATMMEFITALNSLNDERLRSLLTGAYEEVPNSPASGSDVPLCARCGWTTPVSVSGKPGRCANRRCLQLDGVQAPPFPAKRPWEPGLRRVQSGLARYTTQPGGLEMRLYSSLAEIESLQVELWPGYDAYDIGITFPDGETWAIDCKDSGRPTFLAAVLSREDFPMSSSWQRAFYVFPDYRQKINPGYAGMFESEWQRKTPGVSWKFERAFLQMVKGRIRRAELDAQL